MNQRLPLARNPSPTRGRHQQHEVREVAEVNDPRAELADQDELEEQDERAAEKHARARERKPVNRPR